MMKKVMITGGTGMVGKEVLKKCLSDDTIKEIVFFSRKASSFEHKKIMHVQLEDFHNYDKHKDLFNNVDIAYFCLGVYTGAVSDEKFKEITVDYTIAFADALKQSSPQARFALLSGSGADTTEKSRVSFAKYKGMAENYLTGLNLKGLYIFRPGYIYPVEKRKEPNLMYRFSRALYLLIKLFGDKASIKSTELGHAIYSSINFNDGTFVYENQDIIKLLKD